MNILLTNDDGYDSKGIRTLFKLLSKYGTVVIVAPDSPRSANSAALTLGKPIQLVKVEDKKLIELLSLKLAKELLS